MGDHKISFHVNGEVIQATVSPNQLLVDLIRDQIGMTGTKKGCDGGECGSCTVLLDGKPIYSCLTLAIQANGHQIMTIEGLGSPVELHPIQEAFLDAGAVQCGYCSAGMMLSTKALLDENPRPSDQQIRRGLLGNLCRCTGWIKIFDAVKSAAARLQTKQGIE